MSTQGSIKRDDSGKWFFVIDTVEADGKRKQLKRRGFATKKEAQSALTTVQNDLQRGTYVRPVKMRFGTYLLDWVDGLAASGRRPSTIDSYRQNIKRNVLPTLGGYDLQAVTAIDLDKLYSQLIAKPLSMRTVRYVHTIIGKALSDAERKDLVVRNVARRASPPAASATHGPEMQIWTPEQLRDFLAGIEQHHHYPMITLAAMTGLRRAELCGLRWQDVDLDAATVAVRQTITVVDGKMVVGEVKTKRSKRVVNVDSDTISVLKRWRKEQLRHRLLIGAGWKNTGLVFTMPTGEGWNANTITQAFDRLQTPSKTEDAKVTAARPPKIRFHDLRHSHASHALAAGVNVKIVSERLGHASAAFTMDVYAHVMPGQQADAAAAVSALVGRALTQP